MKKKIGNKYCNLPLAGRAVLWFMACNYILKGIGLMTVPVFTRILSQEEYGVLSEITAAEGIILILSNWDLPIGAYLKGLYKYDDIRCFTLVTQFFANIITLGLYALICVLGFVSDNWFGFSDIAFLAMFLNHLFYPSYRFWLVRKQSEFAYRPSAIVMLTYGVSISCVPLAAVLAFGRTAEVKFTVAMFTSALVCLPFFVKNADYAALVAHKNKVLGQVRYLISYQAPFLISSLSYVLLTQLDRIIIGQMTGHEQTARYGVACSVTSGLSILFISIGNAMLPWKYGKLRDGEYDSVRRAESRILIGASVITLAFICLSPEVIGVLFPTQYYEAALCIPALAVGAFYNYVSGLPTSVESYYEKTKGIAFSMICSTGLNVFLNYYFIGHFGYIVCAYTTAASYLVYASLNGVFSRKVMRQVGLKAGLYNKRLIFAVCIAVIPASAIVTTLYPYPAVRYSLIGITLAIALWKRRWITEAVNPMRTTGT